MVDSVSTPQGVASGISALNNASSAVEDEIDETTDGLEVDSAADDAATFAIATELAADLGGFEAVSASLANASAGTDTALAAGTAIADTLTQLSGLAVAASDPGLSDEARTALDTEFSATLGALDNLISSASLGDTALLSGGGQISAITSPDADASLSVDTPDLSLGGPSVTLDATASIATATNAAAALTAIDASLQNVSGALSELGAAAGAFAEAQDITAIVSDTTETGLGNLVDADLSETAADLTAATVQEELAVIGASIANSAPEALLPLFDGV